MPDMETDEVTLDEDAIDPALGVVRAKASTAVPVCFQARGLVLVVEVGADSHDVSP